MDVLPIISNHDIGDSPELDPMDMAPNILNCDVKDSSAGVYKENHTNSNTALATRASLPSTK